MRRVVSFLQTFRCDVGIDLRRDKMRVAQQFLHAAQVRSGIQKVRRVTVPQLVWSQAWIKSGESQIFF